MVFGLGVSFFNWNMIEPPYFVGLGNYSQFFTGDPLIGKVVGNSVYFVLGALPARRRKCSASWRSVMSVTMIPSPSTSPSTRTG